MKKSFFALTTLLALLFFSCKTSSSLENQSDEIDFEETPSTLLPEPQDFEEPLVRDLEIVDEVEEVEEIAEVKDIDEIEEKSDVENINRDERPTVISQIDDNQNTVFTENEQQTHNQNVENEIKEEEQLEQNQQVEKIDESTSKDMAKDTQIDNIKNITQPKNEVKTNPVAVPAPSTNTVNRQNALPQNNQNTQRNQTVQNNQTSTQKIEEIIPLNEVEEKNQPVISEVEEEIVPSRKVTMNTNETLNITYPGFGWIYLGSEDENNNLISTGRKIENDKTIYTLTAKRSGTQLQHFYKVDTITGDFIDDYIEVEVLENKGSVYTVVNAPDYEQVVPPRPQTSVSKSEQNTPISIEEILENEVKPTEKRSYEIYEPVSEPVRTVNTEPSIPQPVINDYMEELSADDLLLKAQSLFNEKQFENALAHVNRFLNIATHKRDEGLFLLGQILEQDGQTKNIKEAISSYTNLVQNYPESDLWDNANKRIIYLNRFYIQIR